MVGLVLVYIMAGVVGWMIGAWIAKKIQTASDLEICEFVKGEEEK